MHLQPLHSVYTIVLDPLCMPASSFLTLDPSNYYRNSIDNDMQNSLPAYQPARTNPLIGLPSELVDDRHDRSRLLSSSYSEGRPFIFKILAKDESVSCVSSQVMRNFIPFLLSSFLPSVSFSVQPKLEPLTIWKYLIPYRHVTICSPSPPYTIRQVYTSILSSLESWFSKDPLTPVNFSLWSEVPALVGQRRIRKEGKKREEMVWSFSWPD